MAAPMKESFQSKKGQKKLMKKILRSQHTVLKHDGIIACSDKTNVMLIILFPRIASVRSTPMYKHDISHKCAYVSP